jgi:hypothetical protein
MAKQLVPTGQIRAVRRPLLLFSIALSTPEVLPLVAQAGKEVVSKYVRYAVLLQELRSRLAKSAAGGGWWMGRDTAGVKTSA